MVAASLVGISTLYTKQHYALDVGAGVSLALIAYIVFRRGYSSAAASEIDRRVPVAIAAWLLALLGFALVGSWGVYLGVG